MSDPVLRLALTDGVNKPLGTFEIRIQDGLSLKLAKAIVKEILPKKLDTSVEVALSALGFK